MIFFTKLNTNFNRSAEGSINLTSFNNFSAIVGMFTVHMKRLKHEDIPGEFKLFRQHMQRISVLKDSGNYEKLLFRLNSMKCAFRINGCISDM